MNPFLPMPGALVSEPHPRFISTSPVACKTLFEPPNHLEDEDEFVNYFAPAPVVPPFVHPTVAPESVVRTSMVPLHQPQPVRSSSLANAQLGFPLRNGVWDGATSDATAGVTPDTSSGTDEDGFVDVELGHPSQMLSSGIPNPTERHSGIVVMDPRPVFVPRMLPPPPEKKRQRRVQGPRAIQASRQVQGPESLPHNGTSIQRPSLHDVSESEPHKLHCPTFSESDTTSCQHESLPQPYYKDPDAPSRALKSKTSEHLLNMIMFAGKDWLEAAESKLPLWPETAKSSDSVWSQV